MTEQQSIHPIGLSDRALKLVQQHAASLPLSQRGLFLESLAKRLVPSPSDDAVLRALNTVPDGRAGGEVPLRPRSTTKARMARCSAR